MFKINISSFYNFSISIKNKIPIVVDPKNKNFHVYKGATLITPNQLEASSITNLNCEKSFSIIQSLKVLF